MPLTSQTESLAPFRVPAFRVTRLSPFSHKPKQPRIKKTTPELIVPTALASPPTVDAYDTYAIFTWVPPLNAKFFNAYFVSQGLQVAANNGQGLRLTLPTLTAQDVTNPLPVFCVFFF